MSLSLLIISNKHWLVCKKKNQLFHIIINKKTKTGMYFTTNSESELLYWPLPFVTVVRTPKLGKRMVSNKFTSNRI